MCRKVANLNSSKSFEGGQGEGEGGTVNVKLMTYFERRGSLQLVEEPLKSL